MKPFFQTIANIFKIEDLRKRLIYTFLLIVVYRLGSYIVIPGIDATQIAALQSKTSEGLVGLLNMFSGGAFGNASIFALGVMPYISASIVIQLLGVFLPSFQRLQREGESGRRKMNQYTRYLCRVPAFDPARRGVRHHDEQLVVRCLRHADPDWWNDVRYVVG